MNYPGFCDHFAMHWHRKYGWKAGTIGLLVGMASSLTLAVGTSGGTYYVAGHLKNVFLNQNINIDAYINHGLNQAAVGVLCATGAKVAVNIALAYRGGVGMTRGGRIVKAFQAVAFALPVVYGLSHTPNDNNNLSHSRVIDNQILSIGHHPTPSTQPMKYMN